MKKLLAVILLGLISFTVWSLWPRTQKPLAEKPYSVVTAAKEALPVPIAAQSVDKQEIEKTKSESSQASVPIPGQLSNPHRIVDADGVVLEERVAGPDGRGEIKRRYSYGEDGRLLKATDIDDEGRISLWDYTYDIDGKVRIRMTDYQGNITTR